MAENAVYWPNGWSHDRLVNATSQDLLDLGDEQKDRMFASLKSTLGPSGFKALLDEMSRNYKARIAAEDDAVGRTTPDIDDLPAEAQAGVWRVLSKMGLEEEEWGFVGFRTCCYGSEEEERWQRARALWDVVVDGIFEEVKDAERTSGGAGARDRWKVLWVEEEQLEGVAVEECARRYRELIAEGKVGIGQRHSVCLVVDEECVRSLEESKIPTPKPWVRERIIPLVRVVDKSAGEDVRADEEGLAEHGWSTNFKVAVEALPTSLFETVVGEIRTTGEMSVGMTEDKVWFAAGGHGRFALGATKGE
ncbi:MAG: hypothetical protein M1821_006651 [Bathelium mastoideum]|nr:MAG: hypothetical protein M1821_006651 [Bathelium mastoideum]